MLKIHILLFVIQYRLKYTVYIFILISDLEKVQSQRLSEVNWSYDPVHHVYCTVNIKVFTLQIHFSIAIFRFWAFLGVMETQLLCRQIITVWEQRCGQTVTNKVTAGSWLKFLSSWTEFCHRPYTLQMFFSIDCHAVRSDLSGKWLWSVFQPL